MLMDFLKDTYTKQIPARWRALGQTWGGKRRCNSGSQCERQCVALLSLIRGHLRREEEEETSAQGKRKGARSGGGGGGSLGLCLQLLVFRALSRSRLL